MFIFPTCCGTNLRSTCVALDATKGSHARGQPRASTRDGRGATQRIFLMVVKGGQGGPGGLLYLNFPCHFLIGWRVEVIYN